MKLYFWQFWTFSQFKNLFFAIFEIAKKWTLVKKFFRDIDLFDFTFFLAWTFLDVMAHCAYSFDDCGWIVRIKFQKLKLHFLLFEVSLTSIKLLINACGLEGVYLKDFKKPLRKFNHHATKGVQTKELNIATWFQSLRSSLNVEFDDDYVFLKP